VCSKAVGAIDFGAWSRCNNIIVIITHWAKYSAEIDDDLMMEPGLVVMGPCLKETESLLCDLG